MDSGKKTATEIASNSFFAQLSSFAGNFTSLPSLIWPESSPRLDGLALLPARSGNRKNWGQPARKQPADERANHGDWRIAPIGTAFPRNRKNRVRDARPKISCRIDCVSGWPAQGKADAPDQAPHQVRAKSCRGSSRRNVFGKNRSHDENKRECCNDLAQQICNCIADRPRV